jgi:serine carboxypeptidase-like clade 1
MGFFHFVPLNACSGDHDMTIPYIATHGWIESLNLTIANDWRPWFVDGQVAG